MRSCLRFAQANAPETDRIRRDPESVPPCGDFVLVDRTVPQFQVRECPELEVKECKS